MKYLRKNHIDEERSPTIYLYDLDAIDLREIDKMIVCFLQIPLSEIPGGYFLGSVETFEPQDLLQSPSVHLESFHLGPFDDKDLLFSLKEPDIQGSNEKTSLERTFDGMD